MYKEKYRMKKRFIIACIIVITMLIPSISYGATDDYTLAMEYVANHDGCYKVTRLTTVSQGGYKGRVKGQKWRVKYPKKVKKGKKVTCYIIEQNHDIKAMVCCGVIK